MHYDSKTIQTQSSYYRDYLFWLGTFNNTFPPLLGIYVTFGLLASDCTMALLASIFRNATKASPALFNA